MVTQALRGGGGNAAFKHTVSGKQAGPAVVVRRTAAIGDALCATVVADKLIEQGYDVVFQSHPNIHCVLRRHPWITRVEVPGGHADIDLDGAYERDLNRRNRHFHAMFMDVANAQLSSRGLNLGPPTNCRPVLLVGDDVRNALRAAFSKYERPWVFICPRSDAYNVRQVADGVWNDIAAKISGTKFWIGRHPGPPNTIDLNAQHMDNVVEWLSIADLLVSVDTGPLHIAAALGTPIVAISQSSSPELHLNDQNDFVAVAPALDCLNCQQNVCPKNANIPPCQYIEPSLVANWANARLRSRFNNDVSAIVPIYQPEVQTLNRCLTSILPQVREVIVTAEAYSRVPEGALRHERIRYVRTGAAQIGYGRNVNFGARHSNGRFLLLLNDDVFLDPGAVDRMVAEMVPGVGMVAHLLRYPDGTIYHAGKTRSPGMRGWGHIDLHQLNPTIKAPTELENCCGASVLVRRGAFYRIGGFDEDFFIYAEDDDFALRIRRDGWRIIYTPHATGIHMEHQSTKKLGDIMGAVNKANAIFHRKWGKYLDHNLNRIPGNFDYE